MGILSAGSALNITVWSYVDQAHISVLSDDRSFADIHEVTDAMSQGLIDIRVAARLSPDMQQIGAVMAPGACEGMTGRRSNGIDSFVQEAVVQLAHRC